MCSERQIRQNRYVASPNSVFFERIVEVRIRWLLQYKSLSNFIEERLGQHGWHIIIDVECDEDSVTGFLSSMKNLRSLCADGLLKFEKLSD